MKKKIWGIRGENEEKVELDNKIICKDLLND